MRIRLDTIGAKSGGTVHLLALSFSLALSGCGGGGGTSSMTAPSGPALQASVSEPDHLTFSVTADKATAAVGEPVTLHIALSNNTSDTITGTFAGDSSGSPTLDPLLFKNTIAQDSAGHYISTDGSTDLPVSKLVRVSVSLAPGQSLSSTLVYTFTRADTYAVSPVVANVAYPTYFPGGYVSAGPLTITVHS